MTINELEQLEKAAVPGALEADKFGDVLMRLPDGGAVDLLCYRKIPTPEMQARFRDPGTLALLIALRNAAPALIAIWRAAEAVKAHHAIWCAAWKEPEACSCGLADLRAALKALEAAD